MTTTQPPAVTRSGREEWWERALFAVSLVAVVGSLAAVEYQAGVQAAWPWWRALGIPLAFDAYAVKTLIDRAAQWWDVAFALLLILAAGALSVFHPPVTWTSAGLVAVLVAVLWRHTSQRRRKRIERDMVAEMGERLRLAREELAVARRDLTAERDATESLIRDAVAGERRRHERELADARRLLLASPRGDRASIARPSGEVVDVDPPPVDGDTIAQVEWVRRLRASDPRATWRDVAEHLQLPPKAAQNRVTAAKRPTALHSVDAVEATS